MGNPTVPAGHAIQIIRPVNQFKSPSRDQYETKSNIFFQEDNDGIIVVALKEGFGFKAYHLHGACEVS